MYKNKYIKGVIDIGTNSCRLFLGKVEENEGKKQAGRWAVRRPGPPGL